MIEDSEMDKSLPNLTSWEFHQCEACEGASHREHVFAKAAKCSFRMDPEDILLHHNSFVSGSDYMYILKF